MSQFRPVTALLVTGAFVAASVGTVAWATGRDGAASNPYLAGPAEAAERLRVDPVAPRPRADRPEDRYALAGGCYVVRAGSSGGYLTRQGESYVAAADVARAEPFHLQAFDLGKYLLLGRDGRFLAAVSDPLPGGVRPVTDAVDGVVRGTGDETLDPVREPLLTTTETVQQASDSATAPLRDAVRGDGVVAAAQPSAAAEWVVDEAGDGSFTLRLPVDDGSEADPGPVDPAVHGTLTTEPSGRLAVVGGSFSGEVAEFGFERAEGCATWPEPQLNVSGPHAVGATPFEETRGYFDGHLHGMAFEFLGGMARCGRPWHPYGPAYALVDCPDHEPGGRGALLEAVVSGGTPGDAHDTTGWPEFGYWPKYDSLTHEQVYYTWLERAWRGGLRMFTNLLVDNGQLCELYPFKKNSCNEMDGVRLQAQRLHELERYIDAQWGGPGRGWFRIVEDPFEARRAINAGRLAVVMGIEVSVPLDCGEYLGMARCDERQIDQRLQEVHDLGVRQMEMTNKFDNALTGVTGDGGTTGVVVNNGNKQETGHYWQMSTCVEDDGHTDHRHDKPQLNVVDDGGAEIARDSIFAGVLEVAGATGAAPVYPAGPHCNVLGLTELGKHMLAGMQERGMVFDPDHMSASARKEALEVLDQTGYSGIISSHSWADDPTYRKILELGGVVTPHAGNTTSFVEKWRSLREWADGRYYFGVGFGSDINGFSTQGGPRDPKDGTAVRYPFTGLGGVVVDRQVSGQQTYDINTDGLDHYGLYPDWAEDARLVAGADGEQLAADLARGAEAYLQMWERALGVAPDSCRPDVEDLSWSRLKGLDRGLSPEAVLLAVGQPAQRAGSTFAYCTDKGRATVSFGADGRLATVSRG